MLLFSFSSFSERRSLKIENENKNVKTLSAEAPFIGQEPLEFHGSKPIRATAVLLYKEDSHVSFIKFIVIE